MNHKSMMHRHAQAEQPTVAVFLPNWVGDAVMCTPALRALRQHFCQARIVAVLRRNLFELLAGFPWFDSCMASDDFWALVKALRRERVATAVLFPNSLRVALAAWLGRCRYRVGYRRDARSFFLSHVLDWPAYHRRTRLPFPAILAYNRLVQELGCADPGVRMELFTSPVDEAGAERIWQRCGWNGRCVVAIHPGAAYGSAKCWPIPYFVELVQRFVDQEDSAILIVCGPRDRALSEEIEQRASRPLVYGLHRENVGLGLVKACLRRVALLVTTDSGPRHIAVAFDRPVVTLFGPTHIAWTETFHPRSLHLQQVVPCGPCQLRHCLRDHRCMRELTPDFVFAQARSWLYRWSGTPVESGKLAAAPDKDGLAAQLRKST